jgi:hypothetical protein
LKHKLYLCPVAKWTQYLPSIFQYIHPCIRAKHAMDKNKLVYEISWVPFFRKNRTVVREASNQSAVPVWINDENEVISNSYKIKNTLK